MILADDKRLSCSPTEVDQMTKLTASESNKEAGFLPFVGGTTHLYISSSCFVLHVLGRPNLGGNGGMIIVIAMALSMARSFLTFS